MKAGALILSFLFIVLSVHPVFIKWNGVSCAKEITPVKMLPQSACKKTAEKTCPVKKQKQPAPQQQSEDCNTCNPFMACNACPYIAADKEELLPPSILTTGGNASPVESDLSSFASDCWHPPELFLHL